MLVGDILIKIIFKYFIVKFYIKNIILKFSVIDQEFLILFIYIL